jgi:hypothetical protein
MMLMLTYLLKILNYVATCIPLDAPTLNHDHLFHLKWRDMPLSHPVMGQKKGLYNKQQTNPY